jgi:hypothetical protein
MFKSIFSTIVVLTIFFLGMNFALTHRKLSAEMMETFGCEYKTR